MLVRCTKVKELRLFFSARKRAVAGAVCRRSLIKIGNREQPTEDKVMDNSEENLGLHYGEEQLVSQAMEACPPFLSKTYDLVDDPSTNGIVSWSEGNNSFIIWNPQAFTRVLLPKYFKHSNFASFVRHLSQYGFRKVYADKWEFTNPGFLRGRRHLLRSIVRRQPQSNSLTSFGSCREVGSMGLDAEIDRMRRDKRILNTELVKLRQQQHSIVSYLEAMEQRLQRAEHKQKQKLSFLARSMQNPIFLHQILQQDDKRKELEALIRSRRRRGMIEIQERIQQGKFDTTHNLEIQERRHLVAGNFVLKKLEQDQYYSNVNRCNDAYLQKSTKGMEKGKPGVEEQSEDGLERTLCTEKSTDEGFSEDLLSS